jgi:hypothetical protein
VIDWGHEMVPANIASSVLERKRRVPFVSVSVQWSRGEKVDHTVNAFGV